ncbi:MAG: CoA-binding protein [Bacteroidetes bacterium]|nr:CoA-binding protein [Bacteroidota bacterium]
MVSINEINNFLGNKDIAVIGASRNKNKFGFIVFNALKEKQYNVFPVNPGIEEINGIKCYPDVQSLPKHIVSAVFITKPEVTEMVVAKLCELGNIQNLWFQQGSESNTAIETAKKYGKNVITGECILMFIKSSNFPHNFHKFVKKVFGKHPK